MVAHRFTLPRRSFVSTLRHYHLFLGLLGSISLCIALIIIGYWLPLRQADAYTPRSGDALQTRARTELQVFTDWLTTNNVKGYLGEFGWPDNSGGDGDNWNRLADSWYKDIDQANLWATSWSTGKYWSSSYKLRDYIKTTSDIDTPNYQAVIIEAHPSTANYLRGVNVSGAEFGVKTDGSFSNQNPGTSGTDYFYDPQATFDYLASRGIKIIRLPFRWERIQPTLNSALNSAELTRLTDTVTRAGNAGLQVILDLHNFGEYYLYDGSQGVSRKVGSQELPVSSLADVWTRLSTAFKNNSTVVAYDLMNEPHGLPSGYTVGSTNATFDSGTDGWVGEGSTTVAQDTTTFRSGSGSLKATKTYGSGAVVSRFNDHLGSSVRDISANGLTLSCYVYRPSGNPGTGWQGHIEIQKSDFTYLAGTNVNLTADGWTQLTYTMPLATAQAARAIVVQVSANNVNATASVYADDCTQGTSQTSAALWQNATQTVLTAIRNNTDSKLIMVPGYNYSGVQSWTSNHPTAWITDPSNNFRYEAHQYWDTGNAGTYTNSYATDLANAVTAGYSAEGTNPPTGSFSIDNGAASTTASLVTLTLAASDDLDVLTDIQQIVSEDPSFAGANWEAYQTSQDFQLSTGLGTKTLYVKYRDSGGNTSNTLQQSIMVTAITPTATPTPTPTPSLSSSPTPSVTPTPSTSMIVPSVTLAPSDPSISGAATPTSVQPMTTSSPTSTIQVAPTSQPSATPTSAISKPNNPTPTAKQPSTFVLSQYRWAMAGVLAGLCIIIMGIALMNHLKR